LGIFLQRDTYPRRRAWILEPYACRGRDGVQQCVRGDE